MEPIKADDNRNWPRASTVAKAISFAANTRLPIGQAIERKCPDYLDFEDEIAAIQTAFTEYKLTRGMLDYDDILIYFAALLEDETIGKLIRQRRSEEHTSELQSLLRISYAIFCLKQKK